MVHPAEQSRPDTLRHRLTGSWLLRKWTPSQPSPTRGGTALIAHDRSLLDSDALKFKLSDRHGRKGGGRANLFNRGSSAGSALSRAALTRAGWPQARRRTV